jgi:predicted Zn-dependent protease with MMP-like domain
VALSGLDWSDQSAPSLDDFEVLARQAIAELPQPFRDMVGDVPCAVTDFATDEVLADLGIESEFDLMGLFHGVGMPQRGGHVATGQLPNRIFLYRRPILDEWAARGNLSLAELVAHVLVHEIGHHFGLTDGDIHAIEDDDEV